MGESKGQFIGVYNRVRGFIDDTKNLIYRQPAQTQQIDQAQRYLPYGINDAFPLKLAKAVQDSVTASSCLNVVAKFIRGSGFTDQATQLKPVNAQKETFWEVHHKLSQSLAAFRGLAICVKYSGAGVITSWYQIPFQYCRLGKPDDKGFISQIVYNPFFGTQEDRTNDTLYYDVFNPDPEVVKKQIARDKNKYKGQILYFGETTPLSPFYPYPVFASAMNWMNIENAISVFHKENLDNGFFQSVLLRLIGDPTAESTHPEDQEWDETNQRYKSTKTVGERFNIEMQKFSGAERVGNIMVQWGSNKDEWPDVVAFPSNGNNELFTALSNEAINKIALSFNVPSVLANINTGANLGGDGNVIRVSVKLMQSRVQDDQMILRGIYAKLGYQVEIVNYNPFPEMEPIDKEVWAALTSQEKRQWIKENTKYPILEAATIQPQAKLEISNALHHDYPEQAKKNAQRAFEMKDRSECGTKNGWVRCENISKGMPLSYKDIKRIYSFLNKNSWAENKLINESCDALLFNAWGGRAMLDWAGNKINSIEL